MPGISNGAGESVFFGSSDAECVRWWLESGRPGDYLEETGESMKVVAESLGLTEGERNGLFTF